MAKLQYLMRAGVGNLAAQAAILTALFYLGRETAIDIEGPFGLLVLLLLVLVPSIIWTSFFYLQDLRNPEPTRYVIVAFFAGMAAAALVAIPVETYLLEVSDWLHKSPLFLAGASFVVIGGLAALVFYFVLRHGFLASTEFDQPADGFVYGAFVGSGFALTKSLFYLFHHPDFTLFGMGYTAATNVLLYAGVASLMG